MPASLNIKVLLSGDIQYATTITRMHDGDPQRWAAAADGWRRLGADMVMLYPMYRIPRFDDQIETLRRFKEVASE